MTDRDYMQLAIRAAGEGIEAGQTPFGACLVLNGEVLATAHNVVWKATDITAHAEVTAIREACRKTGRIDFSGATIYSTCEPCPMCFSACLWARIDRIVYGATIADASAAGFNEIGASNEELRAMTGRPRELMGGVLRSECEALFTRWRQRPGHAAY